MPSTLHHPPSPAIQSVLTPLPAPAAQPQPAGHSQRKRRAAGRLARCAPPGPHSDAPRPRAAACLCQTNRGGDRVAPTGICDLSRRRPRSCRVGALGSPARRVLAEPGRREKAAAPRLDSASQVSVLRPLRRLRLGKLCFAGWGLPGGEPGGHGRGPRGLCAPRPTASRPWGPRRPRTPRPAPIERPRPGLRGLSRGSALPSRALRRLQLGPRRDAGFACFPASPRWGTGEAAPAAGCLGGCGSAPSPSGARSAAGACGPGRVSAGAWGAGLCGRCGPSAEGELGAAEPFAATGFTNGSHTGARSWESAPLGRVQLWHQNLGILFQRAGGPAVHLPQDGGLGFSPRAHHFLREGSLGTEPQRLCAEPHVVDGLPA